MSERRNVFSRSLIKAVLKGRGTAPKFPVTAMSPLQFQKQLRLQEARRLMLGQNLDATSAAYRVGYDDSSHFNREYKRLFGIPPMRDVEWLREAAREIAGST
jgi:AraC-like DNA-binding protein